MSNRKITLIEIPEGFSRFLTDSRTMKTLDEVNRDEELNAVFIPDKDYFRLVESYCSRRGIDVLKRPQSSVSDSALYVFSYCKENPHKENMAYVDRLERGDETKDLLDKMGFYVGLRTL